MFSRGVKWEPLESNRLVMITLIYTKQIIHLSGPVAENSFFARDRFTLVLGQKGDLTTRHPQIIWYTRLPLKYTNMYLFTDKILAINYGVNQHPIRLILGLSDRILPPGFFGMLC